MGEEPLEIGVADGNWVQTEPDKGRFQLLRLYSPLPSFFHKTWRAGEIELIDCRERRFCT